LNRHLRRGLRAALCVALFSGIAAAQEAPEAKPRADVSRFGARVEAALSEARAGKGFWGVLVVDADTGETLYALNAQRYFAPASSAKLFTTALAMATLGPSYRFRTTIETRGAVDASGRLRGDLVLMGRGDPNLSNRRFPFNKQIERDGPPEKVLAELASAVVARGVRQIEGDIIADDSYFASERFPSGWTIDDMMWSYGAAVSALAVQDNTISLTIGPGEREGDPAHIEVAPWAGGYRFQNEVRTGAAGSDWKPEVARAPGSRLFALRGTIPLRAEPRTLSVAVEEPAEHAAQLLLRLLEARGVRVYGEARARHRGESSDVRGTRSGGPTVLAEHVSVPLAEALRLANKISQNLHTELLLRVAAREKNGATTTEAALQFAQDFFKSIGIDEGDVVLFDGSGLSRRNLATPQAEVRLLQYVAQQPWAAAFRSTLPVAGEDGTLAERMKNTAAAGRIWAKTGTLEHANALAGYAATVRGEKLIFAILGNNHNLRAGATSVVDAVCVAMVEELGDPPPEKKKP
jgi:D-alanyl-D-alanine carboxypeptidase/D-alanyl-D-alanine-endopeptidase (penicillin-binding protein 4)